VQALTLRLLSTLALMLAVVWFVMDRGFEPIITAIFGLVGLLTSARVSSARQPKSSLTTPGSPAEDRSQLGAVLVLPFADLSQASDSAHLCDGLADELIARLSKIQRLRVIGRTSSRKFAEEGMDGRAAVDRLGATIIVEGGVRRVDDQLRVTAQVSSAERGDVLWSDSFNGSIQGLFDFQELIASRVASALDLTLTATEAGDIQAHPIRDPRAYEYYLRARYHIYEMNAVGVERGLEELRLSLDLAGENIEILKAMGLAKYQQMNIGAISSSDALPLMAEYTLRIQALSAGHPAVALLDGLAAEHKGDTGEMVRQLRIARNRDPSDHDATFWLSVASFTTGQVGLGRCLARELAVVDPLNAFPVFFDSYGAFFQGRAEDGLESLRRSLELGGRDVPAVLWGGVRVLAAAGDLAAARALLDDLRIRHPAEIFTTLATAFLRALDGDKSASDLVLESHEEWARSAAEWAQSLADIYAVLGQPKAAMEWLTHAQDVGFLNSEFIASGNPFLASIRGDAAFANLVEQMTADRLSFEASIEHVECAS
jgi:TolB-like protein